MTYEELQEYLKGKSFLIWLTFVNNIGDLIEQFQTYGIVSELTNDGLIKIERNDKSIFQIPYNKDAISKADKGEYVLKMTNEIIIDPDFIILWTINPNGNENLEKIKKYGYIP